MNCLYVDFRGAAAAERSRYAYPRRTREALYEAFRPLGGCVVLVTCNRTEVYFRCSRANAETAIRRAALVPARFCMGAEEHLFSLAAGLCSMLAGEDEILGQLRDAYEEARACGASAGMDEVFQAALACGKRVRAETKISSFACSVSTLAANEVARFLKEGGTVLVVGGTGKFGGAVLKNLAAHRNLTLYAAERTHGVAASVRGDVIAFPYTQRYAMLPLADAVVCTTASPHVVFTRERTAEALGEEVLGGEARTRLFIDLAMPPDVDEGVGTLPGVRRLGIDDFARRAEENNRKKHAAIAAARELVGTCLTEYEASRLSRAYLTAFGTPVGGALAVCKKTDPASFVVQVRALLGERQ